VGDSGDTRRAFLAIDLDDATRDLLAAHLATHVVALPGKPVPPRNWHLTLRFLGAASELQLDKLLAAVAGSEVPPPMRVRFTGLGAFPRTARASVLWLGLRDGGPLDEVARICEEAAVAAGFEPEGRPFHPHVSLARVRPPQDLRSLQATVPPFDHTMRVDAITLFESRLGGGPARYEPLERISL
jgi:2'-5' RNA ligase